MQPTVTSVVLGARTKQQLDDNLASINVKLTDEEVSCTNITSPCVKCLLMKVKLLNEKSDVPLPYPYEMVERMNKMNKRN